MNEEQPYSLKDTVATEGANTGRITDKDLAFDMAEAANAERSKDIYTLKKEWNELFGKKEDLEKQIEQKAKTIADKLAEESSRMGLIAYDDVGNSNLIQFRMRRGRSYKSFDLRRVLDIFSIEDGGGHEGAIGFRIDRNKIYDDIEGFVEKLVSDIENVMITSQE